MNIYNKSCSKEAVAKLLEKGTDKPFSDLDLALLCDQPLPLSTRSDLAEDFTESDLPFKVDLVDWATTGARFRKVIESERVVVQAGEPASVQCTPKPGLHGC
jgi:type I restriction enzyme S subunit